MSTVAAVQAKKRISIGDLLMSIVPLFIMLLLNTAATMPALIVGFLEHMNDEDFDASNYMSWLNSGKASLALTIGFIVYAVTAIIIFSLWYKKSFLKNQIKISNKEAFNPKAVALTLVGTIGVWCIIILSLTLVESLFPSALDNYNEIMESSGFGTNEIITVFYVCLLGPIAEEFMFRAVTQGYFRRSGVPVAAVIFGQAVLFGIAHMNIVQSTYAVFIGAFIGLLRYKYGNIRICCLAHIVNNTISSYGISLLYKLGLPDAAFYAGYIVFAAAAIPVIVLLIKKPSANIDKAMQAA